MSDHRVVVGVFVDSAAAWKALDELRQLGFPEEQLGFIVRKENNELVTAETLPSVRTVDSIAEEDNSGTATGLLAGGVVGGVVGAAAALLIPGIGPAITGGILTTTLGGAAVGAAAGGIIGGLTHMGISEEEAAHYEREFQSGRTIVIVQADEHPLEAFQILKNNQALQYLPASQQFATAELSADSETTMKLEPLDDDTHNTSALQGE